MEGGKTKVGKVSDLILVFLTVVHEGQGLFTSVAVNLEFALLPLPQAHPPVTPQSSLAINTLCYDKTPGEPSVGDLGGSHGRRE